MRKLHILLLTFLSLSTPTYALVTIVTSGTTETTPLTLAGDGDVAIVEEGGTLAVGAADAVTMSAANQTVLNQGRVTTTGAAARGIFNDDAANTNATITNSGRISTVGIGADGILNLGGNATISNSGQISVTALNATGISTDFGITNTVIISSGQIMTTGEGGVGIGENGGTNTIILHSGQITTAGDDASGILNAGTDTVIINSGRILTTGGGSFADGIFTTGARAQITNSGQITTREADNHGISNFFGDDVVITNSGFISAAGTDADGIFNNGTANNLHIINSGTIRSAQGAALDIGGTTPMLSLLRGSNLQGPVQIVTDPLILNVETGLNLALTLGTGSFASFGIEAPFALLGQTLGVIDPTGFAMQADVVADLSDTILNGIYRHRTAFPCSCLPCSYGVWVQGLGSYRERGRDKSHVGYDDWQGGFLLGHDTYLCEGNASLFAGVSFGEAEVDQQTQRADTTSYVAGFTYERILCHTFLGLACVVGYVDWDNERFVMNNLAPGGVDKANADTEGFLISPELTLARRFAAPWCHPALSLTLRYAGLFLGDYAETGSLTNLSVKDREIDLLTTRFECALPYTMSRGSCC